MKLKLDLNKMNIEKRLKTSSIITIMLATIASIVALVVVFVMASEYDHTLKYYAFPQGDIGHAMAALADVRSGTRGAIGYEEQELIDKMVVTHDEKKEEVYHYLELIEESIVTDVGRDSYNDIVAAIDAYFEIDKKVIELGATEDVERCKQAQEMAVSQMAPAYEEAYRALQSLMDANIELGDESHNKLSALEVILGIVIIIIIVFASAVSFCLGRKIAKGIAKPLNDLEERLIAFAEGDISSPFPVVKSEDEVASMTREVTRTTEKLRMIFGDLQWLLEEMGNRNFNLTTSCEEEYVGEYHALLMAIRKMNRQIDGTLREVLDAADMVSAGAENLAEASQALAEGATDQATSVDGLQTTMDEITNGLEKTAEEVYAAYEGAKKCAEEAGTSRNEMKVMMEAMDRISDSSKKIGNIIAEIEDIASQTNLLSLNAAIEAARAGEAGKGFAVVAEQIRTLAEQSAKSAVTTRELIEHSLSEVEVGNQAVVRTSEVLEHVVESVNEIADTSRNLSDSSRKQALHMKEANQGIVTISEVVQANSATAEEASATSQELSAQATSMDGLVSKFKLREDTV